jgi:hypothetical protein
VASYLIGLTNSSQQPFLTQSQVNVTQGFSNEIAPNAPKLTFLSCIAGSLLSSIGRRVTSLFGFSGDQPAQEAVVVRSVVKAEQASISSTYDIIVVIQHSNFDCLMFCTWISPSSYSFLLLIAQISSRFNPPQTGAALDCNQPAGH